MVYTLEANMKQGYEAFQAFILYKQGSTTGLKALILYKEIINK